MIAELEAHARILAQDQDHSEHEPGFRQSSWGVQDSVITTTSRSESLGDAI
jgi:hypothetical protein